MLVESCHLSESSFSTKTIAINIMTIHYAAWISSSLSLKLNVASNTVYCNNM